MGVTDHFLDVYALQVLGYNAARVYDEYVGIKEYNTSLSYAKTAHGYNVHFSSLSLTP